MEIDIHNYESILIDYFDGNLNALEVAEVLLFLEQHPEIKKEFEELGVLPEADHFAIDTDFKSQLKKFNNNDTLALKSFNELIVAQMEGDCSPSENELINEIVEGNKSLLKLKNTFQLTKLSPDLKVIYPHKEVLKRKEAVVFYLNKKFAAAAAFLLLTSLMFLVYRNANKNIDAIELAQTKNEVIPGITVLPNSKLIEKPKNIEVPKSPTVALQGENNKTKNLVFPSNKNANFSLLAEVTPERKVNDLSTIPVQPIITIDNNIVLNNHIHGAIIPVEITTTNTIEQENDFLTVGDWMKKKMIERGKNNLIEKERPVETEKLTLEPITIASVGAGIVERTTGKKVFLSRSFDKSGTVKSYAFAAGNFKFERIK